jgi:hypothetical protein
VRYWAHRRRGKPGRCPFSSSLRTWLLSVQRIFRQLVVPSTEPTAAEVTFVFGRVPLFRSVGVMLMLHQLLVFRHFRIVLRPFVAAAGWRNRRIAARHDFKILVLREIKTFKMTKLSDHTRITQLRPTRLRSALPLPRPPFPSRLVSASQEPSQNSLV